jgi:hypothetical protein
MFTGYLQLTRSISIHDPNFHLSGAITLKGDAFPTWKPRRRFIEIGRVVNSKLSRLARSYIYPPSHHRLSRNFVLPCYEVSTTWR